MWRWTCPASGELPGADQLRPCEASKTLAEHGLDFEDAVKVFAGPVIDLLDDRKDYGEARWLTFGLLNGRMLALVWTERDDRPAHYLDEKSQ